MDGWGISFQSVMRSHFSASWTWFSLTARAYAGVDIRGATLRFGVNTGKIHHKGSSRSCADLASRLSDIALSTFCDLSLAQKGVGTPGAPPKASLRRHF